MPGTPSCDPTKELWHHYCLSGASPAWEERDPNKAVEETMKRVELSLFWLASPHDGLTLCFVARPPHPDFKYKTHIIWFQCFISVWSCLLGEKEHNHMCHVIIAVTLTSFSSCFISSSNFLIFFFLCSISVCFRSRSYSLHIFCILWEQKVIF